MLAHTGSSDTWVTTVIARPEGIIAAVDLSYFTALMTRKSTYQWNRAFSADEWDSSVAVVPVKMEYSGSRALLPYLLSFLLTHYWTQRVGYAVDCFEVGTDGDDIRRIDCLHHAGQAVVGGPDNLLIAVVDVVVHPGDEVRFALGAGPGVHVLGRSARAAPGEYPTVRDAIVDPWLGGPGTRGVPPGRQRDAYEALAMMNAMVGTHGVFDNALNLATELSRGFHLGAIVDGEEHESQGLMCIGNALAVKARFGVNGPRVRGYSFEVPSTLNREFEWARRYHISPSGMLAEGVAEVRGYTGDTWPHAQGFVCDAYSVVVSTADHELRLARALQLIESGTPSVVPRHERSLSFWLSGNALLLAGVTSAYLSSGINWAMLNGMLTPSSEKTTSIKALVPLVTNNRITNCVDVKRRLYREGRYWAAYGTATHDEP
ncbi:hypothetical protein HPB51_001122 [Rhipicephalus microplus]|uniref:Uncharacterized protein n=1 Tax=Rhipicephalus microplus TaxID=6941 RepID=A0A9J6EV11_RHIMP|nr:hypothetical protein HPB51_001122 [Rhipicephalus microplus]